MHAESRNRSQLNFQMVLTIGDREKLFSLSEEEGFIELTSTYTYAFLARVISLVAYARSRKRVRVYLPLG